MSRKVFRRACLVLLVPLVVLLTSCAAGGASTTSPQQAPTSWSLRVVLLDRSGSFIEGSPPTASNDSSTSMTKMLADLWPGKMVVVPGTDDAPQLSISGPSTRSNPTQEADLKSVNTYNGGMHVSPLSHSALSRISPTTEHPSEFASVDRLISLALPTPIGNDLRSISSSDSPLSITAPKALAKEAATDTSKQSPPSDATISIQPDFLPVQVSLDRNSTISFGLSQTIEIEDLGFVVNLSTNQLIAQLSPQAQQMTLSGSDLLLIIRHKQVGALVDSTYLLKAHQAIQSVDIQGTIRAVSVRWKGHNYLVFIDASQDSLRRVLLQGVAPGTTQAVTRGCPDPAMLAWSMHLPPGSLKEVGGSPCTFAWDNPAAGFTNWVLAQSSGNDNLQCAVGDGAAPVELSFPWWYPWDQGETQTCDGHHATVLNDMEVADSATITFPVSTLAPTTTTGPATTLQTCVILLAGGLNIRAAPTSQSALIAHYPVGTTLNFVQVVTGEDVDGHSLWGLSEQGHYYWLGGTDHPNGYICQRCDQYTLACVTYDLLTGELPFRDTPPLHNGNQAGEREGVA